MEYNILVPEGIIRSVVSLLDLFITEIYSSNCCYPV